MTTENQKLREALQKIAALGGEWGPCPETKPEWAAMAIVTARETIAALAQPEEREGGGVDNVKSSAGLIRPGKVDAWVANHYTTPPASQEQAQQPEAHDHFPDAGKMIEPQAQVPTVKQSLTVGQINEALAAKPVPDALNKE